MNDQLEVGRVYDHMASEYDAHDDTLQFLAEDAFVYQRMIQPHVQGASRVYDLGCGTGRALHWLDGIQPGGYVGYDVSEKMLANARRKFPNHRFALNAMENVKPQKESLVISLYGSPCYMNVDRMIGLLLDWYGSERFFLVYGHGRNRTTYGAQHEVGLSPTYYGYDELLFLKKIIPQAEITGVDIHWLNRKLKLRPYVRAIEWQAWASRKLPLLFMEAYTWIMIHVPKENI